MPKGVTPLQCDLYDVDGRNAEIKARQDQLEDIHGKGAWSATYDDRAHALIWSLTPTPAALGGLRAGPED